MNYKFIGGVLDGQYKDVSGNPLHYRQPVCSAEREQIYSRCIRFADGSREITYEIKE